MGTGIVLLAVGLWLLAQAMTPTAPLWHALVAAGVLGVANPLIWGPLSTTATRNLPMADAGAGAGVYNTTRQMGAVLGSAAIAVLMQARITAHLGPGADAGGTAQTAGTMPPAVAEGLARALAESIYLPMAVILLGALAALFFERPPHLGHR